MHEDVKQHQAKAGTPHRMEGGTSGGQASFVIALFSGNLSSSVTTILFILFLYGLVGFLDDFLKVFPPNQRGTESRQKLFLQLFCGVFFISF